MRSYFEEPENWAKFKAELESWIGTPFWGGVGARARKGVAADCVAFVEGALTASAPVPRVSWPPYVVQGGGAAMLALFQGILDRLHPLKQVWSAGAPFPEPVRGDLLLISSGRALHHLAVFCDGGRIIHCLAPGGVQWGSWGDPMIAKHLLAVYRVPHVTESAHDDHGVSA